jgi:hypothetical protein
MNADQIEELGHQMRKASEAVEEVAVQLYAEAHRLRTEAEPRVPTGVNTAWRGSTVQTDECYFCLNQIEVEEEMVLHFREPTDKVRWPVHVECYLDNCKEPQHLPVDHPVRIMYEGIRRQAMVEAIEAVKDATSKIDKEVRGILGEVTMGFDRDGRL